MIVPRPVEQHWRLLEGVNILCWHTVNWRYNNNKTKYDKLKTLILQIMYSLEWRHTSTISFKPLANRQFAQQSVRLTSNHQSPMLLALCEGNPPVGRGPVMQKPSPCHDVIMLTQDLLSYHSLLYSYPLCTWYHVLFHASDTYLLGCNIRYLRYILNIGPVICIDNSTSSHIYAMEVRILSRLVSYWSLEKCLKFYTHFQLAFS